MRFDPPRPQNQDERILPLIDVVLMLLIFFMLAGKLAASDPIKTDPPISASEAKAERRELVVIIGADGRLAVNGTVVEDDAFKSVFGKVLEGKPSPQVWLKADGKTDSVKVIELMDVLREAGVERLKLLTLPGAAENSKEIGG
jgi:biopolymer transport protein ExbD